MHQRPTAPTATGSCRQSRPGADGRAMLLPLDEMPLYPTARGQSHAQGPLISRHTGPHYRALPTQVCTGRETPSSPGPRRTIDSCQSTASPRLALVALHHFHRRCRGTGSHAFPVPTGRGSLGGVGLDDSWPSCRIEWCITPAGLGWGAPSTSRLGAQVYGQSFDPFKNSIKTGRRGHPLVLAWTLDTVVSDMEPWTALTTDPSPSL